MHVVGDERLIGEDHATEHAPAAVDVLGRRIDDDVRAERQRLLQNRRREHVVDDQLRACLVRDLGNRRDVVDLQRRVGRRLDEEQFRVLVGRLLPRR